MTRQTETFIAGCLAVAGLVALIICLLPGVGGGRHPAPRTTCRVNLMILGLALHNYHDAYESFPPAHLVNDRGTPIHSWRALTLPYLDQVPLYNQYDFSQPWSGPENWALAGHIILPDYQCPSEVRARDTQQPWTSYVAVVEPHTTWPGSAPTTIADITDGIGNTLQVVESHNTGIHWMEPRDFHVRQMSPTINSPAGQGLSSLHEGGSYALFADGAAKFLSDDIDPSIMRRLTERDDGESVPEF